MTRNDHFVSFELYDAERAWFKAPGVTGEFTANLKQRLINYRSRYESKEVIKKTPVGTHLFTRYEMPRWLRSGYVSALVSIAIILGLATGVVYAIGIFTGYVPGFGFIGKDPLVKILSSSASQSMDGIQLKLVSVVAGTESTAVVYSLGGLPLGLFEGNAPLTPNNDRCENQVWIELANGKSFKLIGAGSMGYGNNNEYLKIAFFDPLPNNVKDASFKMACIEGTYPDQAPENWSLHFELQESSELKTYPVLNPSSLHSADDTNFLTISNLIPIENQFIVVGRYIPPANDLSELQIHEVTFLDNKGTYISYDIPGDIQFYNQGEPGWFAYIVDASIDQFPIKMQAERISYTCWGEVPVNVDLPQTQTDIEDDSINQQINIGACQISMKPEQTSSGSLQLRFVSEGNAVNYLSIANAEDPNLQIGYELLGEAAIVALKWPTINEVQSIDFTLRGVGIETASPLSVLIDINEFSDQ